MSDVTSRAWWRWMEGMLGCLGATNGPTYRVGFIADGGNALQEHNWHPVEDDPATLGCLTQRARDLWQSPGLNTSPYTDVITDADGWCVRVPGRGFFTGPTEFAALLAACDAAPNPTTSTANPQGDAP